MTDVLAPRRDPADPPRPSRPPTSGGWFRAVWRWHFFASFLVVPVLLLLATTGLIYLFRFQLEPLMHPDLMKVDPPAGAVAQPYVQQLAVVESAYPGSTRGLVGRAAGTPTARRSSRSRRPAARAATSTSARTAPRCSARSTPTPPLSGTAIRLHGELMVGTWGDYLIELGACWAVVMAITGYYLFVRGWRARRRARKADRPGARLRSRHGLVGAVRRRRPAHPAGDRAAVDRLLGREGADASRPSAAARCGARDPGAASDPTSTLDESLPHSHAVDVPWAMGDSEVPSSTPPADGDGRSVANVDTAVAGRRRRGAAAPDDRRAARGRRRGRRLLGDRLRLRRAVGREDRARRPVRRRGGVDVRLRRLPGAGQGGLAGHRPARGPQPRAVVLLGLGADVPGDRLHVPERAADVVAPSTAGRAARSGRRGAGCRSGRPRCWRSCWSRSGCSCRSSASRCSSCWSSTSSCCAGCRRWVGGSRRRRSRGSGAGGAPGAALLLAGGPPPAQSAYEPRRVRLGGRQVDQPVEQLVVAGRASGRTARGSTSSFAPAWDDPVLLEREDLPVEVAQVVHGPKPDIPVPAGRNDPRRTITGLERERRRAPGSARPRSGGPPGAGSASGCGSARRTAPSARCTDASSVSTWAVPSIVDHRRAVDLAGRDPGVGGDVARLARGPVGDHPRAALLEVERDPDGYDVRPAVGAQRRQRAQVPLGPELQQGRGNVGPVGLPRRHAAHAGTGRAADTFGACPASRSPSSTPCMDRTVAPGYTRLGPAVRRHLSTWPADPPPDALAGKRGPGHRREQRPRAGHGRGPGRARRRGRARRPRHRQGRRGACARSRAGCRWPSFDVQRCDLGDLDDVRRFAAARSTATWTCWSTTPARCRRPAPSRRRATR